MCEYHGKCDTSSVKIKLIFCADTSYCYSDHANFLCCPMLYVRASCSTCSQRFFLFFNSTAMNICTVTDLLAELFDLLCFLHQNG